MAEQRLRLTVDVFADPDIEWRLDGSFARDGEYSVANLTEEIQHVIDTYPGIDRTSDCLFERLDRGSKERLPGEPMGETT